MKKTYISMKVLLLVFCFITVESIAQPNYCPQQATSTADDEIFRVAIGTMTNTSICNQLGGPGSIASMYQNYTGILPANLTVGSTYSISVTGGQCSGNQYSGTIYVWIDYNQDGLFTGVGELVYQVAGPFAVVGTQYNGTLTIPFSALFGPTRMRVTLVEGSVGGPCTNFTWGEVEDYNVNIIPNTPCSSVPSSNTIVPASYSTCPGLTNPALTLANQYTVGGIQYQWMSSTVSPVGPFLPIPGATLYAAPLPTLGITTWFQAVATCTNVTGSYTTASTQFYVAGVTTNSVPYYEDFEGIQGPNRLPNCSWWANNIGTTVNTYTASASNNRVPRSGTKFGGYALPSTNNIVYTNGIQMDPGITYSAAIHYATEYFGYNNWTNLSILIGTSQAPGSLTLVASVSPAISGPYKLLSGTYTVPSSGLYYVAFQATGASGNALYLSFDDISVTIPCDAASGNEPNLTLSASATTICANDQVSLNANGAGSYLWSTGATGSNLVVSPPISTLYSVIGTNLLSGCSQTVTQLITVNPAPSVFIVASKAAVCPGETVFLTAYANGPINFVWSNSGIGSMITVAPQVTTTYSATGTNNFGCSGTSSEIITVKPRPTITAVSSNLGDICVGESVSLSGNGGSTYSWYSSSNSALLVGNPVVVYPNISSTYTVIGVGANGCSNTYVLNQSVVPCTGLGKNSSSVSGIVLYPNPAQSLFTVSLSSGLYDLELTDISGRLVLSRSGNTSKTEVDISALSNGIYYAKITSNGNTEIIKVVKE